MMIVWHGGHKTSRWKRIYDNHLKQFQLQRKNERIKKMLTKAMTIHELLTKNLFEINLKRNNNVTFWDTFNLKLECDKWLKDQMLWNI
jgi:hypothetical protein